jgi:hypothetical protein
MKNVNLTAILWIKNQINWFLATS